MQIRLADKTDLPAAAQLWFERIALLQQTDPHFKLLPEAMENWRAGAESWITDDQISFLVAEQYGELIGFTVVEVAEGKPGLHPARRGLLLEMAIDLHDAHRGLSERLLDHSKRWLATKAVEHLEIDAPAHYPVEAAFWRAQQARLRFNRYWLKL